ncbi:MAG: hypothetical protein ACE5IW_10220 [bacterium]
MRIEFKAKLEQVREIEEKEKVTRQRVLLQIPVYDTFTGEQVRTENFPAAILNKNIDKIKANEMLGEIVKCVCFLTSFKNEQDDNVYWNLSLNCVEMEVIKD